MTYKRFQQNPSTMLGLCLSRTHSKLYTAFHPYGVFSPALWTANCNGQNMHRYINFSDRLGTIVSIGQPAIAMLMKESLKLTLLTENLNFHLPSLLILVPIVTSIQCLRANPSNRDKDAATLTA